jgi:hypothetical protein
MYTLLGKRGRQNTERSHQEEIDHKKHDSDAGESQDGDAQAIFRRHFEAHFAPLVEDKASVKILRGSPEAEDEDEDEETEWSGLSDTNGN